MKWKTPSSRRLVNRGNNKSSSRRLQKPPKWKKWSRKDENNEEGEKDSPIVPLSLVSDDFDSKLFCVINSSEQSKESERIYRRRPRKLSSPGWLRCNNGRGLCEARKNCNFSMKLLMPPLKNSKTASSRFSFFFRGPPRRSVECRNQSAYAAFDRHSKNFSYTLEARLPFPAPLRQFKFSRSVVEWTVWSFFSKHALSMV